MSDPLRNLFDRLKPSFQGSGKLAKYFPLFDVFENLFYSSDRKTYFLSGHLSFLFLEKDLSVKAFELLKKISKWAEENNIPQKKQTKNAQLRSGGVTQSGISADLDQFEEPTADPEAPEPGSPQPGQPGQTPGGQTPGGTGGGGQV